VRICGGTGAKVTRLTLGELPPRRRGQDLSAQVWPEEGSSQPRAYEAAATAKGPNKQPWTDAEVSMTKVVAESRTEMSLRPRDTAAGSRRCSRNERQTATATKDNVGPQPSALMEEVLRKENLKRALKRVRANKGSPGVDGMTVDQLSGHLREHWPHIREQLLNATYVPEAVRVVKIPKPSGGTRMLGIPTVQDRWIQQAILQVIGPIFDAGFSDHSYGFRPGRDAQQAVEQARSYMAGGQRWVVDLDLEKFFDQVNHDMLMSRVARKIKDKRLLKLIRRYLAAGMMTDGVVSARTAGTPQGGPLSPLLSNVLLDDLDKELERRGHHFCRYADDCNIYVSSRKAGERVMESVTRFLEHKLKLKVNRAKSAVGRPWDRKFLGYTVTTHKPPRLKPAPQSVKRAKAKIREIVRRGRGRNIQRTIEDINLFVRGWFGYFRKCEVKQQLESLDEWLRHHLRSILWRQWKTPRNRARMLQRYGTRPDKAKRATSNGRGPWWNACAPHMHAAITNATLFEWGLLSLLKMYEELNRTA
jgi:RNA-directed DNA polymerase